MATLKSSEVALQGCDYEVVRGKEKIDRSKWRVSKLFAHYARVTAKKAWQYSFTLGEMAEVAFLVTVCGGIVKIVDDHTDGFKVWPRVLRDSH
jgi:hypothetical protein